MEPTVQVAVIAGAASIVVAVVAHVWTQRQKRADQLRQQKTVHYAELLGAISALADKGYDQDAARRRFATAANTIALVAPPEVISALMAFHDSVSATKPRRCELDPDKRLKELLVKLRRSLALPYGWKKDFDFHLVGTHLPDQPAGAEPEGPTAAE
jgi:hypothetical protein